jgi:adenylate kinase
MIISIIGGSGSGKDTQASFISERYNTPHISMGEILRDGERKGDPLAVKAMEIANEGKWVPDEITSEILAAYVRVNCPEGFIITGYPRPEEQIKSFDRIAETLNQEITAVVHIRVPEEVMMARMRKQAEDYGEEREDTTEEAMRTRIKSYQETINPLIREYSDRGILIDVDGTPSIQKVKESIFKELDALV